MTDKEILRLVCYDNKDKVVFPISRSAAKNSNFILNYIENIQEKKDGVIKLDLDSKILKAVAIYLEHFKEEDKQSIKLKILGDKGLEEQFSQFEVKFIKDYDLDVVVDIINAAEDLQIPGLHNLACARIAEYMMFTPDDEILKEFKITCNIPEQDYNEIMRNNKKE